MFVTWSGVNGQPLAVSHPRSGLLGDTPEQPGGLAV